MEQEERDYFSDPVLPDGHNTPRLYEDCETCGHNKGPRNSYHGFERVMIGDCVECTVCMDRRGT